MNSRTPERKEGFKKIPNNLYRKLCTARLSGAEMSMVLVVYAQTEGYRKSADRIAISQFMKWTGNRDVRTIQRARDLLIEKKILIRCAPETSRLGAKYRLDLDLTRWRLRGGHVGGGKDVISSSGKNAESRDGEVAGGRAPHTEEREKRKSLKKNFKERKNILRFTLKRSTGHVSIEDRPAR